jgi:hypothetical protein
MIVALAEAQLLVGIPDVGTDRGGMAKVEGCAGHRTQFPGGNQLAVHRGKARGVDLHHVLEHVARAAQVEVVMLTEAHDRVRVARGAVLQSQRVVVRERVHGAYLQVARKAALAVRTEVAERELRPLGRHPGRDHAPHHLVEPHGAAVQGVVAVIAGEGVALAIERKGAVRDAVGVATDQRAQVRAAFEIAGKIVVPQHHVRVVAGAVGRGERGDGAAVGRDPHLHAVRVAQRVELDRLAVGRGAKGRVDECVAGCRLQRRRSAQCQHGRDQQQRPANLQQPQRVGLQQPQHARHVERHRKKIIRVSALLRPGTRRAQVHGPLRGAARNFPTHRVGRAPERPRDHRQGPFYDARGFESRPPVPPQRAMLRPCPGAQMQEL